MTRSTDLVTDRFITRRCRTHVLERRELETMRRFIAINGGNFIGHFRENDRDVGVVWFEDVNTPVDVSDFPTYRMIDYIP